jgi:hypothetical protein
MRGTMLLSATSNGVGVNVRLVGYGLSVSRYQGIYRHGCGMQFERFYSLNNSIVGSFPH